MRFDPATGLDVSLGSSRIQVPANALLDARGQKLRAPAELCFTLFDVTQSLECRAAPGDFVGRLRNGKIQRLTSFGIFDFAVRDAKGKPAVLAKGAKVKLAIALPPKLARLAPKKIAFFDFDAIQGLWNQIGDFTYQEGPLTYNGEIDRFPDASGSTAYNLDDPQTIVCVMFKVVDIWNQLPLQGATVYAEDAQIVQYQSSGTTDGQGLACLLVRNWSQIRVWAELNGWTMPAQLDTFATPGFDSDASAWGDPDRCPLLGQITMSQ